MSRSLSYMLLLVLALLGNHFNLGLFFGVSFIFGSVAVLVALRLYGVVLGTLMALLAGLYTYYLWGHAYALVIFTLEAVTVGLLLRKGLASLILADALYWLLLGAPLVWLFYAQVMGMESTVATVILLKQPINGVTNAIIASFVLLLLPATWLTPAHHQNRLRIGITELVFSLLIAISFVSMLVFLIQENRAMRLNLERSLEGELVEATRGIQRYLQIFGEAGDYATLTRIFTPLEKSTDYSVLFLSANDKVLFSNMEQQRVDEFILSGSRKQLGDHLMQWQPLRAALPLLVWWKRSQYYVQMPIGQAGIGSVVYLKSATPLINSIYQSQIRSLSLLIAITLVGMAIAYITSRWLNRGIISLSVQTNNLPDKLRQGSEILWPRSRIEEIDELSRHAEIMSNELAVLFGELVDEQEVMEIRVKQSVASLDESYTRSQAIIDTAVEGIVIVDEAGYIESFNPAAERMFGLKSAQADGKPLSELLNAEGMDNRQLLEIYINSSKAESQNRLVEAEGKRSDGELFPVEIAISEVQLHNTRIYTVFISDISERKQAERLKNEFISNVSHELRTPLTSIRGAIGLLASNTMGEVSDKGRSLLKITLENTERLVRLINDILDIQKLEAGGLTFVLRPERLRPIIQQVVEQNSAYVEQFGASISLRDVDDELMVRTEPDRLNQVLTNLISNAAKFSPEGGTIRISVDRMGDDVRISIADQGPGIPREFHDKLFQKFSQYDGTSSRRVGGTGLGLNISKNYMLRMQGDISFDSEQGSGTTFHVSLPIYEAQGLAREQ